MKERLDQLLVARGLVTSRTVAQALILEGKVRVAGQVERKAARLLSEAGGGFRRVSWMDGRGARVP